MTDPEQEEVFDAYLKRRSVLPALDDKLEPPVALDEKVLTQAREAILPVGRSANRSTETASGASDGSAARRGSTKSSLQRPPRWAVPVALAATILLCLSVVINISLNTHRPSPNIERMNASRADVKASALANATAESNAAAGVSAPSGARDALAANNGERRERISGDIPSHEVVLPRAKVAGTRAPRAPVVAEASTTSPSAGASGALADTAQPAEAPALASTDAAAKANRSVGDAASRASPAMASANSVAPITPAAPGGGASVTGRAGDVPADPSAADKAVLMAKEAGVAASRYAAGPERERSAASARKAAKAAAPPHPADPKVWLRQIDSMRASGKTDQADAEMRRFKAAFPNYGAPAAPADLTR